MIYFSVRYSKWEDAELVHRIHQCRYQPVGTIDRTWEDAEIKHRIHRCQQSFEIQWSGLSFVKSEVPPNARLGQFEVSIFPGSGYDGRKLSLPSSSIWKYMIAKHWRWLISTLAVIRFLGCTYDHPTISRTIVHKREIIKIAWVRCRFTVFYIRVQFTNICFSSNGDGVHRCRQSIGISVIDRIILPPVAL